MDLQVAGIPIVGRVRPPGGGEGVGVGWLRGKIALGQNFCAAAWCEGRSADDDGWDLKLYIGAEDGRIMVVIGGTRRDGGLLVVVVGGAVVVEVVSEGHGGGGGRRSGWREEREEEEEEEKKRGAILE